MLFNYASKEIIVKIVYYGPALSGKTTNLEYIHKKSNPQTRGKLISLATETDRTLFFDLLPMDLGKVRGFYIKLQLYTVPGQVKYNSTRKLVLKGVDAIVFVADSSKGLVEANIESMKNLKENLKELGIDYTTIPAILQFNKQDLSDRISKEELNSRINDRKSPCIEASAINGSGVFETLKEISKLVLDVLNKSYEIAGPKTTLGKDDTTKTNSERNIIQEETSNSSETVDLTGDEGLNNKILRLQSKIISLKSVSHDLLNELISLEQLLADLKSN
ncbi:MAG: hypothetical protein A2149_05475 [Candidatus Schekmanbacteria bacterium RBG_16_38_11]|uniref:Gliding-motility protein MglA n=1 Tax=Candidatus Schekmanbacteria bacterium RBG_16_38_11 TaxID=1817880 RepID=A0A1F7S075_9BACT|nr:MAG: hypothetical protein A2149_05475 [Candidatus Schekmanbacteria bacterium RBG_16_38_11]